MGCALHKPAIPSTPKDPAREKFDKTVKESLEIIMGRRDSKVKQLAEDASLSDVIAKINEILTIIQ